MSEFEEKYLGDGCYVSFDGWQLKLRAPRIGGDHEIYLEPQVWEALLAFVASLKATTTLSAQK